MAFFDTGLDLLGYFLRRVGDVFPNTATSASGVATGTRGIDGKLQLQQGYWDLAAHKPWRWNRFEGEVRSVGKEIVTVSTIAGAVVTLSAPVTPNVAGYRFSLDGESVPHRVLSGGGATAVVTLEGPYMGTLTSGPATLYKDELALEPTMLAFPSVQSMHQGDPPIRIIPEDEFQSRVGRNLFGSDRVRYATFIGETTMRIAPWTDSAKLFAVQYNYRPEPLTFDGVAGTDTPVVPRHARELIALFALRKMLTDKRDARLTQINGEIAFKLPALTGTELSLNRPRMWVPRNARVML